MGKGWTWRKIRETRVENGPRGASLFERMLGLLLLVILLVHPTQITIPQILWFAKEQPEGGPAALGSIARLNLTVADALIFATFGLWFLWRLVPVWKRERMRLVPWPVIFLTIFAILSLLESLKPRDMLMMGQSFDAKDGVKELVQFAEFFIIALVLFRNLLTDRLLLKKALTLLVIVFTVVIIVGWTQFARFRPPGTEGASEGPRAMAISGRSAFRPRKPSGMKSQEPAATATCFRLTWRWRYPCSGGLPFSARGLCGCGPSGWLWPDCRLFFRGALSSARSPESARCHSSGGRDAFSWLSRCFSYSSA